MSKKNNDDDNDDDDDNDLPPNAANNIPSNIGRMFGLSPINPPAPLAMKKSGAVIIPDTGNDYEHSRSNIKDLIEKGSTILAEFSQVASQAQEPRHYEVLTTLLSSLVEANEKLLALRKAELEIQEKEAKLKAGEGGGASQDNVTNNIIVGSTDDILSMLAEKRKKQQQLKTDGNDDNNA